MQAVVDDICWMLRPLMEQSKVSLYVPSLASIPPVFVDATLTRQALFRVSRLLMRPAGEGSLSLTAIPHAETVDIVVQREGVCIDQGEEDWEVACLLMSCQGGRLEQEAVQGPICRVVISLPIASRARVLVVDDIGAVHRLFERYLAPHNYEVIGVHNGAEALRLASARRPDLIILDVMMPAMDGWQVLRDLQSNPATASIPVVVCSVLNEPELALSLGARAFISKPVDRLVLLNTLDRVRAATAPG